MAYRTHATDPTTMDSRSTLLETIYLLTIPLTLPYLTIRRAFRQVFGQRCTNIVFQRAGLATTADFLRLVRIPIGIRTWIDVKKRYGFEKEVVRILSRVHGSTFADVGASLGYYSFLLRQNFRTILAFEPHPENVRAMREMVRLAGTSNITVYPVAVSDTDGEAVLHIGSFSATHSLFRGTLTQEKGIRVRTIRLDSFLTQPLDLVKIDVEGAEWKVLTGAEDNIRSGKVLRMLIEVHDGKTKEMDEYLNERGYLTKWVDDIHVFAERKELTDGG